LANANSGRGPRDAALPQQGIKMNQQIQVDTTKIDSIDAHYRSNLFDQ
jgi:hypothetical protein